MTDKYNSFIQSKNGQLLRAAFAEFLGTGLLVIFACGACVTASSTLTIAVGFGLTLMCLAVSFGHISGCHVNPAVTVGLLVDGKVDIVNAITYLIGQFVGAVVGAAVLKGILPEATSKISLCECGLNGVDPFQAIIIEAVITFVFVLVIVNVVESNPTLAPLVIGLALTTGHLLAVPLTGASMNTARAFGPALIRNKWDAHYVYWVGPLIGGTLAGAVHRFILMDTSVPNRKSLGKPKGDTQEATNV
ncbi:aquaporin-like [Oppia nitens]|uniref:aquaporin-like n=1 Tax=Oppia nitens TaxID=1686743 RepID=UPI0023DA0C93|nr:aquaporin-like [Oppia nitens]